jgi:hypothetical protein
MSKKEESSDVPSESSIKSSLSSSSSDDSDSSISSDISSKEKGKKSPVKGKDNKNKRKRKDPNAPKKPMTSYMLYMQAQRAAVVAANPSLKFGDVSKKISEDWKVLPEDQKKIYEDKAAAEKARYDGQMKSYVPPDDAGDDDSDEKRPKKKAKKDPNAPKRGQNAYMFFVNDLREKMKNENTPMKAPDLAKLAGEKWRTMTSEDKKPFEDKAAADKERADRETAAYKSSQH